ncbi:PIN domain-containing protein [Pyrolobus fumarii]|uniref:PIN domain-containing protein n=1 Tax=Pyrolobus fumarii TaxID=54252 RepID=UPI0031345B8B
MLLERVFKIHELARGAALTAARIRLERGVPEVDSLILATAVEAGYDTFYTFDVDFRRLNGETIGQTKIVYLG